MSTPAFKARIEKIHQDIDRYSYYQLLNVQPTATVDEIRDAFHRVALGLHPDRYHAEQDEQLRRQVYVIYKRITEGYRVLTEPQTRREYDEALARGERRLVKTERQRTTPQREEDVLADPQARKYFVLGKEAQRRGDTKNAKMYYTLASNLAGEHPLISDRLAALEEK